MTRKSLSFLLCAGLAGGICAGLSALFPLWANHLLPLLALPGQGLRALSLSGVPGNLLTWIIVAALSALPLLLLILPRNRSPLHWEDALLPGSSLVLFLAFFYMANPTELHSPIASFWPVAAFCTLSSLLASWFLLRLYRRLAGRSGHQLPHVLHILLQVCGVVIVFFTLYSCVGAIISLYRTAFPTDPGIGPLLTETSLMSGVPGASTTLWVGILLAILDAIPLLFGALVLLMAADLTTVLGCDLFGEDAVRLCQTTADRCRQIVQLSLLLSASANLIQLLFFNHLLNQSFSLHIPLLTLACSFALSLLCRCIQQGKVLQEDSQSII